MQFHSQTVLYLSLCLVYHMNNLDGIFSDQDVLRNKLSDFNYKTSGRGVNLKLQS